MALWLSSAALSAARAAPLMQPWSELTPPPFELADLRGDRVALAELRGRVVLLNFWATWCAPCIEELPSLERLSRALADEPFELVAVNMGESPEVLQAFLARLGLEPSFTVAVDADGVVTRDWRLFAYPTTVLLDADGRATLVRYGATEWDAPEMESLIRARLPTAPEGEGGEPREPLRPGPGLQRTDAPSEAGPVSPLAVPAAPGAREPDLALDADGIVHLSWLEPRDGGGVALRSSRLVDGAWSAPVTIAAGDDWFVNWADFPSIAAFGDGGLAAWWPVTRGEGPYAYDLHVSLSADGGASWGEPIVPHRDGTPTQHGLTSLLAWPDGRLFATWLDGRVNADGVDAGSPRPLPTDDMTLRSALIARDGSVAAETLLDARVCTCCATEAVRSGDAVLVAYRDRTAEEVRDISIVRHEGGAWSAPYALHRDGWKIAGCPVNGPALAADGALVVASWFTAVDDRPRVLLARSDDGGRTFSAPIGIDDGRPLGRVDTVLLDDGGVLVSWLELIDRGEALRLRRVPPDATAGGAVRTLATAERGRTIGFPKMVRSGDAVIVAWTQSENGALGVRTVSLIP